MDHAPEAFRQEFQRYIFCRSRWLLSLGFAFLALNYIISDFTIESLGLPSSYPAGVYWAERGVLIPSCLGAALVLALWGNRPWTEWVVIVAGILSSCAIIVARRAWQLEGYYFPSDYSPLIPSSLAVLTALGNRIWLVTLPMVVLNLASAYYIYGDSPNFHFESFLIISVPVLVAAVNWQLRHVTSRVWLERQQFQDLSRTDPLTGLHNRRSFEAHGETVLDKARREDAPVAVAMIDLDSFKPYNDLYGHAAGDRVLVAMPAVLTRLNASPLDMSARMGGEEFVCIWYGVSAAEALRRGQVIVERIRALGIVHEGSAVQGVVTASVGIHHSSAVRLPTLPMLLREADAALYIAKSEGRNRAVLHPQRPAVPQPPDRPSHGAASQPMN